MLFHALFCVEVHIVFLYTETPASAQLVIAKLQLLRALLLTWLGGGGIRAMQGVSPQLQVFKEENSLISNPISNLY